jgi:pimeloyl-ACP methyl ester carboxylesterase
VLALHCSLGSGAQWRSLAKVMPERQVMAPDLLGYGDAPVPTSADNFSLDEEVDAVEKALSRRWGTECPLHVVGHSYGGAVAWRFALRNPHRVKSLALFEPVTLWFLEHEPEAEPIVSLANWISHTVAAGLMTQAAERFVDFWSGAGTFNLLPAERRSAVAQRIGKVKLDFAACAAERSSLPMPQVMQMPALLMNGSEAKAFMRTNLRVLQRAFAKCFTAEVPGGHMAPVESRDQVNAVIAAFIRRSEYDVASRGFLAT